MSAEKKTISDVGGIPDGLQHAYDVVIKFEPSGRTDAALVNGALKHMAAEEATIDGLKIEQDGVTPGLQSLLRQAAIPTLSSWQSARSQFDTALQPYMDKINASLRAQDEKATIDLKAQEQEQAIVAEAEAHKPYADSKREKERAESHFEQLLQGEGGRPVNTFGHTWLYFLVLAATTSIEWLINYDALFSWLGVPFLAAGGTVVLAWAIGTAAHVHGTYIKQWTSRFAPHTTGKGRYVVILIAATVLLLVVTAVAGWARYSLAMHSIAAQGPIIATDQAPAQPNPTMDVLVSLGFNLLIWLIGLVIAFFAHDENHELMDAHLERTRKRRRFNRLHKPWEKRIQLVKAKATRQLEQLRAATALAVTSSKSQRDMLEQVNKREEFIYRTIANQVQAVADLYRIALGNALAEKGNRVVISGQSCSGQQYLQVSIKIDARSLRTLLT